MASTTSVAHDQGASLVDVDIPTRSIGDTKIPYDILKYIPQESAEHYRFAPLGVVEGVLEIGMVDPDEIQGIDALNFIGRATGMPFKVFKISEADFDRIIKMYGGLSGDVERAVSDLESEQRTVNLDIEAVPLDISGLGTPLREGSKIQPTIQKDP